MAESLDKQLDVADAYAQALFELAQEAGQVEEIRAELDELVLATDRMDDSLVREFFLSRALDNDVREQLMEKTLRGKISDITLNTLLVLNANGRHGLLMALRRCYVLRQQAAAGQVEATATSAVELDDGQQSAIQQLAEKLSGQKPLIAYRVDPAILGGLILQIGDLRYDNSLRSQLMEARERLYARSERGLDIGIENG
jgi:F-type H+-transporting ATPase subunit delta